MNSNVPVAENLASEQKVYAPAWHAHCKNLPVLSLAIETALFL